MDLWEMDVRRFGAQYRSPSLHAQAHARGLRDLLRHPLPRPRAPGRPPAAGLAAPTPGTATTARRSARSRAGSASTGTSPTRRRATRRCARAAGRASTGRRRSAPSTVACRERAALFDESSFAKIEVAGPGRRGVPRAAVRQPRRARASGRSPTRRCSTRRGGIECDFTVTRAAPRTLFSIVTGTAFGNHDLAWIRRHAPADGVGAGQRRHRRAGPASGCGARAPATCWRRSRPRPRQRGLPAT